MKNIQGLIYVILFSLAWSIQTIIDKFALSKGIEPISFTYQTLLLAALFLFCYNIFFKKEDFKKIQKKSLGKLAFIGFLGGIATILSFYGLKYSTANNYGFIIKFTVIFSILLAFIFLKEKITFKKIILMIILLLGLYLISTKGQTIYPQLGDLIILLAAFVISVLNIMLHPILKKNSAETVTFFRTLFGGLIILVLVPFIIPNVHIVSNIYLLFLRSIFVFLTLFFLNKTIQETSISYMTMMSMMYSVFVAIFAYFILNETLTSVQAVGGLLIIISVILIQKSLKEEHKKPVADVL